MALRIGSVAPQLDVERTLRVGSLRSALMEAMHKVEGDLMDRCRVIHSATANFATYDGNFCRYQIRPHGMMPGNDEIVMAIELAFGKVYVSLGMMDRTGVILGDSSRRIVRSTGQELVDAISELDKPEPEEIVGGIVAGSMSSEQLRDIMRSLKRALPHLVDRVNIPLGDPDLVTAVGAACAAWGLVAFPNEHVWEPEDIRHDEL